ncbi:MAG TPA: flavin reductase family protein [Nocardioidaceae bacterium]|nr:flavin reductase family protein [Nocardioidaceae bacterium]
MSFDERRVFRVGDGNVNAYRLLTAVVVPRPIAWVTSQSVAGVVNLAPHSFYTVACARPPIVQFTSVGSKDTLRNVQDTGEFVVNLAHRPLLAAVNNSSASYPADQSEPAELGIAMRPSLDVAPPTVRDSPAAIECRLHSTNRLGDSTVVLGDVVAVTVAEEVLVDGHPDYHRLDPLSRLGKDEWGVGAEVVSLRRPRTPEDLG